MSESFAPGPWTVVPYGDGDSLVIHSDNENRVCFMATHGGTRSQWERIQANAALIAAAPDLYEALTKLCDQCEAEFTTDGKWDRQGQLVTEHAYKRARAALLRAQASEQSGG